MTAWILICDQSAGWKRRRGKGRRGGKEKAMTLLKMWNLISWVSNARSQEMGDLSHGPHVRVSIGSLHPGSRRHVMMQHVCWGCWYRTTINNPKPAVWSEGRSGRRMSYHSRLLPLNSLSSITPWMAEKVAEQEWIQKCRSKQQSTNGIRREQLRLWIESGRQKSQFGCMEDAASAWTRVTQPRWMHRYRVYFSELFCPC